MPNDRYQKIENNLNRYFPRSSKDLKIIARDLLDRKIFCDRHLNKFEKDLLPSIFMPIALGGDDTLEFFKNEEIDLIFEYYDKSGHMQINGRPIFGSCRYLNKSDTERMFKFYEEIKKIKEKQQKEIDKLEIEE